jgi:hypothetical protein
MTKVSLHRFVELPRRFLVALGLGVGILTVGAIAPPPAPVEEASSQPLLRLQTHYAPLSTELTTDRLWHSAEANLPELLTVTFYTPTATCETYQGEERAISADKAIPQIVHFLVSSQTPNLVDFELAGYRVQPGTKGNTVTIDFRRAPEAQRHFISLSICEQRVLFGSLRQTLLKNPDLNIDTVRFTERGRPIEL